MQPLRNETNFQEKNAYVKIWLLYIWTTPTFYLPKEQNIFQMTRPTLKCTTLGKFGLSESGLMLFCPVSRLHSFPNDLRERHYSSVNWTPTKEEDGLRGDKTRKGNLNKKVLKSTIAMFGQHQYSLFQLNALNQLPEPKTLFGHQKAKRTLPTKAKWTQ